MSGRADAGTAPAAPSVVLPLAALAVGVGAWWLVVELLGVPAYVLPAPGAVAGRLAASPGLYARNAVATLGKVVGGGGVGVGAGFLVGTAVAQVPVLRRALLPYLVTLRVLPKVAVAPVLLLYVGVGFGTAVLFVALVAFFPMTVSTAAGFRRVPDRQRDLLRSVDAHPLRALYAVELPFALPDVFAGAKQSVALSVVGAVVAEWVVADRGLGYLVLVGAESVQVAVVLAALAVLVAVGLGLYGGVVALQRRVLWER